MQGLVRGLQNFFCVVFYRKIYSPSRWLVGLLRWLGADARVDWAETTVWLTAGVRLSVRRKIKKRATRERLRDVGIEPWSAGMTRGLVATGPLTGSWQLTQRDVHNVLKQKGSLSDVFCRRCRIVAVLRLGLRRWRRSGGSWARGCTRRGAARRGKGSGHPGLDSGLPGDAGRRGAAEFAGVLRGTASPLHEKERGEH